MLIRRTKLNPILQVTILYLVYSSGEVKAIVTCMLLGIPMILSKPHLVGRAHNLASVEGKPILLSDCMSRLVTVYVVRYYRSL